MNKYVDETEVPMSPLPGGTPGVPATQNVPDVWPIVPVRTVKQIQRRSIIRPLEIRKNLKSGLFEDRISNGRALAMAIAIVPTIQKLDH